MYPTCSQHIHPRHLPGVPSAAEVDRQGLLLGDLQVTLLRNMEALTRYSLELESRITNLEGR
jgi:hypothetical protein